MKTKTVDIEGIVGEAFDRGRAHAIKLFKVGLSMDVPPDIIIKIMESTVKKPKGDKSNA